MKPFPYKATWWSIWGRRQCHPLPAPSPNMWWTTCHWLNLIWTYLLWESTFKTLHDQINLDHVHQALLWIQSSSDPLPNHINTANPQIIQLSDLQLVCLSPPLTPHHSLLMEWIQGGGPTSTTWNMTDILFCFAVTELAPICHSHIYFLQVDRLEEQAFPLCAWPKRQAWCLRCKSQTLAVHDNTM